MTEQRVTGIGGIFFRSKDKSATGEWYKEHLGLDVEDWGGTSFLWRERENPDKKGSTVWSPFAEDTDYFGKSGQEFMINLRVRDLDAVLAQLEKEGVTVLDDREESDFGRFAWIVDCDGRRVELWEPPEGM